MSLEFLTSDELAPFRHGFFTRLGGASTGVFESLNCGPGSDDDSAVVDENRRRVADAFGQPEDRLATVHQTHSADVLHVTEPPAAPRPKCDAMVTDVAGIVLGILTADCQPVLFADASAGVVGAAHAGWKGALGGVLEATVEAMEGLGARRENIAAVIGPSISQENYEVGPEFHAQFLANDPSFAQYFAPGKTDRMMFDLPGFGLARLTKAGLGSVSWTGHCTYADPQRFFSFRRATHRKEQDYGRLISAIMI